MGLQVSEVFLVVKPTWTVRPPHEEDTHQDPLLCMVQGKPCLGALSHPQSLKHLLLVISKDMIRGTEWGCRLTLYSPIKLSHSKQVECLGLGLAFSAYGLFLVINLEQVGRVVVVVGEQEEAKEEGCAQCHEKQVGSWCSLKVTLLLWQRKLTKNGFSHFLYFCAIRDTDLIKI